MGLFGPRAQDATAELVEQFRQLEADNARLRERLTDAQELIRHLDEDRDLMLAAMTRLHPGLSPLQLAETLLEVCFKPLGLACFYLALADWEEDWLTFVLYHEGGRARNHPSRRLSDRAGLSERVLESGRSLYIRTTDEGQAAGSHLTPTEQATGLIPHSWYGVPLGTEPRPVGLLSFQSFEMDAFSEGRRRIMDALGTILCRCLPQRP